MVLNIKILIHNGLKEHEKQTEWSAKYQESIVNMCRNPTANLSSVDKGI